jgi:hypothetical protein
MSTSTQVVPVQTDDTPAGETALATVEPKSHPFFSPAEMRARGILSRIDSISAKLKTLEDDIRLLWADFENLKAGETILGCATKKEFCEKKLHRHPRTIQYLLAGQSNPADRPHKEPSELSSLVVSPVVPAASPTQKRKLDYGPPHAEPESLKPAEPSRAAQLREWFGTKYKAFRLEPSEQNQYELTIFNLTTEQVRAIGEVLGRES